MGLAEAIGSADLATGHSSAGAVATEAAHTAEVTSDLARQHEHSQPAASVVALARRTAGIAVTRRSTGQQHSTKVRVTAGAGESAIENTTRGILIAAGRAGAATVAAMAVASMSVAAEKPVAVEGMRNRSALLLAAASSIFADSAPANVVVRRRDESMAADSANDLSRRQLVIRWSIDSTSRKQLSLVATKGEAGLVLEVAA